MSDETGAAVSGPVRAYAPAPQQGSADQPWSLTWREMQALHAHLDTAVERALQEAQGLSSREFALLEALHGQHDGPGGHLHMKEVADAVNLSQSATTRLVTRMEDRGLLKRGLCPDDRRGVYSNVTAHGAAVLAAARQVHESTVLESLRAAARTPRFAHIVRRVFGEVDTSAG